MKNIEPIIKWAGGKRKLAPLISKIVNEEIPSHTHYVEPFFGGGSVYFDLYSKNLIKSSSINDLVPQLVNFYKTFAVEKDIEVIHQSIVNKLSYFNSLDTDSKRRKYFSYIKKSFNNLWSNENRNTSKHRKEPDFLNKSESKKSTVLLYVLNRTCFNGLFRVNRKGEFNVPIGSYEKVAIPNLENMKTSCKALSKAEIFYGDYEVLLMKKNLKKNSFVYLDPPYVPNSKTSDFTSYSKERFKKYEDKDSEHKRLAENFTKLVDNGTKAILSNHNNEKAWSIFVEGKKNIFVYGINITKTIGRVKGSKNSEEELLISSFEIPFLKDKRINL